MKTPKHPLYRGNSCNASTFSAWRNFSYLYGSRTHYIPAKNLFVKIYIALKLIVSGHSVFGFKSSNRNTLIMKNLIKPTLILVTAFLTVLALSAQAQINTSQTEIFHEFVEGKFNHLKATNGNVEVIFRNDRLEIFESSPSSNEEKQSFLFFDNANKVSPEPLNMVKHSVMPITNSSMAEVLGVSEMNVDNYEKVIYRNIYNGADLVIAIEDKDIKFTFETKSNQIDIPFSLSSWGDSDMIQIDDIVTLQNHSNVGLSSTDNDFELKGRALNFSNTKSKTNKISFTLNFLN